MSPADCIDLAHSLGCVAVLPTYNNAKTLASVIADVKTWCSDIIVVNDGSTDYTQALLDTITDITIVNYPDGCNRGKGYALKTGLRKAIDLGFSYAVTLDTDGQHFAKDIPTLLDDVRQHPDSLIIGARNLQADGMPSKNTFANKFSNFWFKVETLISMSDTQSGYRLYPLRKIAGMKFYTPRYEFEVEIAVRLAWKGVRVINVPVSVLYPEDRVSHFRPGPDFFRISLLNTVLVTIAFFWFYPKALVRWVRAGKFRSFLSENLIHTKESTARLASAVALGVAMSIVPCWGFQLVIALGIAHILQLNKLIVAAFANISLPPVMPFIIFGSLWLGGCLLGAPTFVNISQVTLQVALDSLWQYILGAFALAAIVGSITWCLAWLVIFLIRQR